MRIAMPCDRHDHATCADSALPQLSDEAAVQIHNFIAHFFDLFEARYSDQIRRYYDDRSQYNMIHPDTPDTIDDPPF